MSKIKTTIAMSNTVNGIDADWDELVTVEYRAIGPREIDIRDVRDSLGVDVWPSVSDADWSRLEELCLIHSFENASYEQERCAALREDEWDDDTDRRMQAQG